MRALLLAATLTLAGCISSGVEVVPSTKPVRPGEYQVLGPAEGTSVAGYFYVLSFIPIHFGELDVAGHAKGEALRSVPGSDALVDAVMDRALYFIPIPLFHILMTITTVEGTAVKTPAGPDLPPAAASTAPPPKTPPPPKTR
jgi:hypothetical protein